MTSVTQTLAPLTMSASPPCGTPPSLPASSTAPPPVPPDTLLAAANMRRLLEVYRSGLIILQSNNMILDLKNV